MISVPSTLVGFLRHLRKLPEQGYIVIASQYSGGGPGSEGCDEFGGSDIQDVLNLYKILKGHPRANANAVGMYGHSRGGLMTYRALANVTWIRAAVSIAAPSDEVSAPQFRKGWGAHQKKMYGGSRKEQIARSALYWTHKFPKHTPLLIMHGTADWRVNPLDSIKLAEKLHKARVPFRLVMFEGADHGLSEVKDEKTKLALAWFDRFLKQREKVPDLKPHGK